MTNSTNTTQFGLKVKVVPKQNGDRRYTIYNSEENQVLMITTQKKIVDVIKNNQKK